MFDETPSPVPADCMPAVGSNSLPELADLIRTEHAAVEQAKNDGLEHAYAAGTFLNEAKPLVRKSGKKWMTWVKEHCGFSHSTANKYMRVAKMDIRNAVPNLSFREAVRLTVKKKGSALRARAKRSPTAIELLDKIGEMERSRPKEERVLVARHLLEILELTPADLRGRA